MQRKKPYLLVIVVLLASAGLAEAGFQIGTRYTDDRPFDPDMDVLVLPETLYLSIYTDETEMSSMSGYFWALVCDWSLASITDGVAGPDAYRVTFWGPLPGLLPGMLEGEGGQYGAIAYAGWDPLYYPGLYMDKFVYRPTALGDVTVRFLEVNPGTGGVMGVPDSIVIHQIPEPMTILLLAVGGLIALCRRQNARGLIFKEVNDGKT